MLELNYLIDGVQACWLVTNDVGETSGAKIQLAVNLTRAALCLQGTLVVGIVINVLLVVLGHNGSVDGEGLGQLGVLSGRGLELEEDGVSTIVALAELVDI